MLRAGCVSADAVAVVAGVLVASTSAPTMSSESDSLCLCVVRLAGPAARVGMKFVGCCESRIVCDDALSRLAGTFSLRCA
jgi:hypothetical protein